MKLVIHSTEYSVDAPYFRLHYFGSSYFIKSEFYTNCDRHNDVVVFAHKIHGITLVETILDTASQTSFLRAYFTDETSMTKYIMTYL